MDRRHRWHMLKARQGLLRLRNRTEKPRLRGAAERVAEAITQDLLRTGLADVLTLKMWNRQLDWPDAR